MRPKHILPLLLAVLLLAACSPLRRTQRNRKADSTAVDHSEIRKAVHDILRESGTLTQTIVEFYPPVVAPPERANDAFGPTPTKDDRAALPPEADPAALTVAGQRQAPLPAVKRIIRTEIAAERERETTTDSTARNDIHTTLHTELSDKVAEKPPAGTATAKWIAIALAAIAAIILLLKIPKIMLPRL